MYETPLNVDKASGCRISNDFFLKMMWKSTDQSGRYSDSGQ